MKLNHHHEVNEAGENLITHQATEDVFVYGTLKTGFSNNAYYLADKTPWLATRVPGVLHHMGGCPGLLDDPSGLCYVTGQVFRVSKLELSRLDRLEGVPNLYNRRRVTLPDGAGEAWTYYLTHTPQLSETTLLVDEGIWRGPHTRQVAYGVLQDFFKNERARLNQINKDPKVTDIRGANSKKETPRPPFNQRVWSEELKEWVNSDGTTVKQEPTKTEIKAEVVEKVLDLKVTPKYEVYAGPQIEEL